MGRKSASNLFEKMRENTPFYTCNIHTGYKTYIHFVKKYPTKDLTLTRIQIHENDLKSDIRIVNLVGTGILFNW